MTLLWGISFHAVKVFGLGKDLLFKSVLGQDFSKNIFAKVDEVGVKLHVF